MMLYIQENKIRFNCNQKLLRNHITPTSRDVKVLDGSENVRHKNMHAYRGLTGGFLLLQNFCVAISVSPHVCFILVLILISMFL